MGFWSDLESGVRKVPVLGNAYDKVTGKGAYAPVDTGQLQKDNDATRSLRDQFGAAYAGTGETTPLTMGAATIDNTQGNSARTIQTGGLGTTSTGLGIQQQGAGIQLGGLDAQREGIDAQRSALDVQRGAVGMQLEGVDAARGGLATQQRAADAFGDVLAGKTPSVAEMTGRRLAGEAAASAVGAAAGASGGGRAAALRTAINASGAAGTRAAADAAIGRAGEQDVARRGLLDSGTAQAGTGATITGAGSQIAGTGAGIAGTGQGITAGGQGISATGQGVAGTGSQIVNTGAVQSGIGTATRGQDIDVAKGQAELNQNAGANNLRAGVENRAQDITRENVRGNLALGGTTAVTNADTNVINQQRQNNADQRKNDSDLFGTAADIAVLASDPGVKTDVGTPKPSQVSELFRSFVGSSVDDDPYVTQPTAPSTPASLAREGRRLPIGPDPVVTSDKRAKTGAKAGGTEARDLFADVMPKTFKYKPGFETNTEGDEHLGVMADDVERSGPLGRGMVKERGGVKTIDIPMAVSGLMAAVADIEKRIGKGGRANAR